jgi:hypothetical protein
VEKVVASRINGGPEFTDCVGFREQGSMCKPKPMVVRMRAVCHEQNLLISGILCSPKCRTEFPVALSRRISIRPVQSLADQSNVSCSGRQSDRGTRSSAADSVMVRHEPRTRSPWSFGPASGTGAPETPTL